VFKHPVIGLRLVDPRFYHLDTCFCPLEGGYLIESLGIIDEIATFKRAKTGVEMVKAWIDKPQTDHGVFENAFVCSGRSFIGPEAKSAPDERLAAIEQGIAGTFEKNILRPRRQWKTI